MRTVTIGPMARYVDDLALACNILRGPDPSSPYTVPTNKAHPETFDIKKVRYALFTDGGGVPVSGETRAAVEHAGSALQRAGVEVEQMRPPIQCAAELWWLYATADGGQPLIEPVAGRFSSTRWPEAAADKRHLTWRPVRQRT